MSETLPSLGLKNRHSLDVLSRGGADELECRVKYLTARVHALEFELSQSVAMREKACEELKRETAELDALAAWNSIAECELAHALKAKQSLEAELEETGRSLVGRLAAWTRYLGRLCTQREEASFFVFRVSVLLGLSRKKRELRRQVRQIAQMGLVDLPWYQRRYRHLAGAFLSPVAHYLYAGVKQGCDPNPFFDSQWYLKQYRSSVPKGVNPLVHYIRKGAGKKFNPNPSFDTEAYLTRFPNIQQAGITPLSHFLENHALLAGVNAPLADESSGETVKTRVVYISAEPDTPGHIYRVSMYANALATRGYEVHTIGVRDVPRFVHFLKTAAVIILWRTAWNAHIETVYSITRERGAKVIFDIDDLMIEPELANAGVIDAIRFSSLNEAKIAAHFALVRKSAENADFCTAPTEPLSSAMRLLKKPGLVIPNGFDEETYIRTRRALAERRAEASDGLIRLGYAGGTRTHQKDFARAVPALARILRKHPECRLVLFRIEPVHGSEADVCLDPSEYPELVGFEDQIEWMPFRPLRELPSAIARFDINLAPLEHGNSFCEAKSELKYFEAALAEIPTVASPTVPYAAAITHGKTGFLASNDEEWFAALEALVCDSKKRDQIGKAAFDDVYWRYGPERRAEVISNVMEQVIHGGDRAVNAFQLDWLRQQVPAPASPLSSEYDVLFESGRRAESAVAAVVSLSNDGRHAEEILESIKAQTLSERDLMVVDDCSSDDSASVALAWLQRNASAFSHVALLRNKAVSGRAATRNAGIAFSDALYIMILDAENLLSPNGLERLLAEIVRSGAAVAYPLIRQLGKSGESIANEEWNPVRLAAGHSIHATALIRRSAWARAGGYQQGLAGSPDDDLWSRFVKLGLQGSLVREVLAQSRV